MHAMQDVGKSGGGTEVKLPDINKEAIGIQFQAVSSSLDEAITIKMPIH
jgi:hypothetical protein